MHCVHTSGLEPIPGKAPGGAALLAALLLTLSGGALGSDGAGSALPSMARGPSQAAPTAPIGAADQLEHQGSALEYACPMHPGVVSDVPGSCPICGMRMVTAQETTHPNAHEHGGDGQGEDPHAHHRAMMSRTGYIRSEQAYVVPELTLVGMDGEETTLLAELEGDKPVMLNFIFTTCTTICPVQSATFAQIQRDLGVQADDVRMISISIDPEHDTPERLREYAQRFGAGPQWRFLTGSLGEIIAAQKAFDAYRGSKMSHEPVTFLRASPDEPWIRLNGIVSASEIVKEYRELVPN